MHHWSKRRKQWWKWKRPRRQKRWQKRWRCQRRRRWRWQWRQHQITFQINNAVFYHFDKINTTIKFANGVVCCPNKGISKRIHYYLYNSKTFYYFIDVISWKVRKKAVNKFWGKKPFKSQRFECVFAHDIRQDKKILLLEVLTPTALLFSGFKCVLLTRYDSLMC